MSFKSMVYGAVGKVAAAALEYDTLKIVHIKDKRVGFIYRTVQLAILLYIIVYGIIWQQGYQITGPVTGTVTSKVKGAYHYAGAANYAPSCDGVLEVNRTFDAGDFVIPPEEPNSFFVMTNLWQTCGQVQGECAESSHVYKSNCTSDDDCIAGKVFEAGNGPATGRCVANPYDPTNTTKQCQIQGWCPVELEDDDVTNSGPKVDISKFTVLIKNVIEFPTIQKGLRKRNIRETQDKTYFQNCLFNETTDLYCPIFSLEQIVHMIKPTRTIPWQQSIANISVKGGVVGIELHWDCDHLEFSLNRCDPKYVAKRYDDPNTKLAEGFNYRFSEYYYEEGIQKRILTKVYGVLFKLEISGTGGKFDFVTFLLKIGSMIALLGIASVVADILVLYICKGRSYYRKKKYLNVNHPTSDYVFIDSNDPAEIRATLGDEKEEDEDSNSSDNV